MVSVLISLSYAAQCSPCNKENTVRKFSIWHYQKKAELDG